MPPLSRGKFALIAKAVERCYTSLVMKQERLWARDFILTIVSGFFAYMVLYSILTTMAVYATEKYGVSEGLAGFTASIAMAGSIAGRLFAGNYSDRIGRRRVAIAANLLNAVCCTLYFLPAGIGLLLVVRFLHGVMIGCIHNVMATVVIDFIPPSRRAEGIGLFGLNFILAIAIGPALGLLIVGRWSYEALWGLSIVFSLVGLFVLLAIRFRPLPFSEEQNPRDGDGRRGRRLDKGEGSLHGGILEKAVMPLAFMIIFLSACYSSATAFIETYTLALGIAWIASWFFAAYSITVLVARPILGRLIDRRGENFVMVPIIIVNASSFLALGLAGVVTGVAAPVLVVAAAALLGIGFGTILPMGSAIAVKYVQPRLFTKVVSTYFVFSDAGMGIGALLLGLIASRIGFSGMFLVEIAVALVALLVYWQLHGRNHRGSGANTER